MSITIVIADDHPVVLDGLVRGFSCEPDFQVVASVRNGDEALRVVGECAPDILVLDLRMPGKDGIRVIEEMRRNQAVTKVIVFTASEGADAFTALRLGAQGIVLKDEPLSRLTECVRRVHAGETWIEGNVAARALHSLLGNTSGKIGNARSLTRREAEIARLVAEGLPSKHVARKLSISDGTTRLHLHHIYSKLNLRGRMALMRYVQRNGLG